MEIIMFGRLASRLRSGGKHRVKPGGVVRAHEDSASNVSTSGSFGYAAGAYDHRHAVANGLISDTAAADAADDIGGDQP